MKYFLVQNLPDDTEVVHREAYDALAAEVESLKAQLAYAASTGDECAIEVESLRSQLNAEREITLPPFGHSFTVPVDKMDAEFLTWIRRHCVIVTEAEYTRLTDLEAERELIVARAENAERALEEADERHGRYIKAVGELAGWRAAKREGR